VLPCYRALPRALTSAAAFQEQVFKDNPGGLGQARKGTGRQGDTESERRASLANERDCDTEGQGDTKDDTAGCICIKQPAARATLCVLRVMCDLNFQKGGQQEEEQQD
jgi:hypothetical protein